MKRKARSAALPREAIDYLNRDGTEINVADGEPIVSRGDRGENFYVIIAGSVEVRLTADRECKLPLVSLGIGAFFGEMSILTGEAVSADVVATGPATVLCYPGKLFSNALSECAELRNHIMTGMAANLQRTTTDAWNFFQRAEALNVLMDSRAHIGTVVAESRSMQKAVKALETFAADEGPLLIRGERGTGKTFLASHLHRKSPRGERAFIIVDCRSLSEEEAAPFLFGSSWIRSGEGETSGFGSLQNYGALHLANEGTLILRHIETLADGARDLLLDYMGSLARKERTYPDTRIIATLSGTGDDVPERPSPHPDIDEAFAGRSATVPPLKDRRRDILPLASLFLDEYRRREDQRFSLASEHTLLSRRYTHSNVDELREAIEMAALFADGDLIDPEHIFTGPKDQGDAVEYPLDQIPTVQRLTSPSFLKAARALVFTLFAGIIVFSLLFRRSPAGAAANTVTWSLWEPALLVFFLFVGRVWCTVCPLSTAGRIASGFRSLGRAPDGWLKKHTGWFVIASFIAIVWSEHTFHMTVNPFAAGILLLALMAGAVFFAVIYRRETWCRYVCPLGNLGAVYALPAVLSVRANPNVCATICTTHECYKGSEDLPGCPVFHHPLYARDAHHCKQCYTCLRACPNDSAKLYLRLPLRSVWQQGEIGTALVPFALFLFFFSPAMLASQGSTWAATTKGFTFNALLSIAATLAALPLLPRLLAAGKSLDPVLSPRVAFSLLVLAWGPAMAYQLNHIDSLAGLKIQAEAGSGLFPLLSSGELTVQASLQAGVILLAGLLAFICLSGIRWRNSRLGTPVAPWGWRAILLLCAVYTALSLFLVMPRSFFPL